MHRVLGPGRVYFINLSEIRIKVQLINSQNLHKISFLDIKIVTKTKEAQKWLIHGIIL